MWEVDAATSGVLVEDHRAPLVELRLEFPVGTWSAWPEPAEDLAAAWHLQFRDPSGRLRARADLLAADLELRSGTRSFTLAAGCRREDLDSLLVLVREILANREFDAREVKRHNRGSDIEWKDGQKDPRYMLGLATRRVLWRGDDPRAEPLEKPRHWGKDHARMAAVRDTLVRLPGRVIGFAGDLTRAEGERLASILLPPALEAAPASLRSGLKPVRPAAERPRSMMVPVPRLTQAYFRAVRHALPLEHPDYPAMLVTNHVLGGHYYSRLMTALRHEGGHTYGARSRFDFETDTTAFVIHTYTRTANADTVEHRIRAVLEALHEEGITEEEHAAAVGYLRGRLAFQRQAPVQILERFLWERMRGLPPGYRDATVERAAALSLEEINAFARRFYDPAAFTLIVARVK
jgi:zinc protease